jgi:hypothetical protein
MAVNRWWQFSEDNLRNAEGLVDRLKKAETPLSRYIRDNLSDFTREELDEYESPGSPSDDLLKDIVSDLNRLIRSGSLYDQQRFAGVNLTEKTHKLINLVAETPQDELPIRLNRLLLAEAYPDEITLCSVREVDITTIIDNIQARRCVPFLGAAANVSCKVYGYRGLPLGSEVGQKLIEESRIGVQRSDEENLARVSQQVEIRTGRPRLISLLKTILPFQDCSPSPLLRVLAKLPFKLIVTANYDELLEQALRELGREYEVIIQPSKGFEDKIDEESRITDCLMKDRLVIYKIHGAFQNAAPKDTIVVTEDDYIEFLTMVCGDEDTMGIPTQIVSTLKTSTILFLGYSLEDWNFRSIHRGLIEQLAEEEQQPSFAIQKKPSEFWVRFWQGKKVEIYNADLYEFAEQLEQKYVGKHGNTEWM